MKAPSFFLGLSLAFFASPSAGVTGSWTLLMETNSITDLAADGSYLWCATNGGLVRWDTRNMSHTLFTVEDGLQDQALTAVGVGPDGSVWVGSEECSEWGGNLSVSQGVHWTVFQDENGPGKCISTIAFAPDGSVWVGANNTVYMCGEPRAVHRYDGKSWSRYDPNNSLFFTVSEIAADPGGNVWIGTWDFGVLRYDGKTWTTYSTDSGLPSTYISAVAIDSTHSVWAGSTRGVSRFNGETWRTYTTADGLPNNFVRTITVAPDGMVWVGTDLGVSRFDGDHWVSFSRADGLPADVITSIAVSPNGTVWAGTLQGLGRYDGTNWSVWRIADGPPSNNIYSIAASPDGMLWYSSAAGIGCFDGKTWEKRPELAELDSLAVTTMKFDSRGNLWIGVSNSPYEFQIIDVYRFDGNLLERIGFEDDPAYTTIRSFVVDPDGEAWAILSGGTKLYHCSAWSSNRFSPVADLPNQSVISIATGPDGTIWIASTHGVYSRNYQGEWIPAPPWDEGMEFPRRLAIDSRGTVFAASSTSVGRLDGDTWSRYPVSGYIYSLSVDSRDRIWAGVTTNSPIMGVPYLDVFTLEGNSWSSHRIGKSVRGADIEDFAESSNGVMWVLAHGLARFTPDIASGVFEREDRPAAFALLGNHPNPFNPSTTISFTLPEPGKAELNIYDITGRKVRSLLSGPMAAGTHSVVWDGRDESAEYVSSGVYLFRIRFGGRSETRKMLMVR